MGIPVLQKKFSTLHAQHGVLLENLVYYRSSGAFADSPTHYFVMTTDMSTLHAFGALKPWRASRRTICAQRRTWTRPSWRITHGKPSAPSCPSSRRSPLPGQLSLFDFSERKQSNRAAKIVGGAEIESKQDTPCIVTRVGDALQEPFWPEGLGINRGFLGVYGCADLVPRRAAPDHGAG